MHQLRYIIKQLMGLPINKYQRQKQKENGANRNHDDSINHIKEEACEVKNTVHFVLIYWLSVRTIRLAEFAGKGSILVRGSNAGFRCTGLKKFLSISTTKVLINIYKCKRICTVVSAFNFLF